MTEGASVDRTPIRDDSHARAILKRELRAAFRHRNDYYRQKRTLPGQSFTKHVKAFIENFNAAYGDLIVFHTTARPSYSSKKTLEVYTLIDMVEGSLDDNLPAEPVLDLQMIVMDPVKCVRSDFGQGTEIYSSCRLSLHLLERLIRREQAHTMKEITFHLIPLSLTFSHTLNLSFLTGKFVLITRLGYYVMKMLDEEALPMAISWIPRDGYTTRQAQRLSALAEHLVDESFILSEEDFKTQSVVDPEADGCMRLPGLGHYLPDPQRPRHVVLTPDVFKLLRPYV